MDSERASNTRLIGSDFEEQAASRFLAGGAGTRLLARNYSCKGGEIDLIFEEEGSGSRRIELVFVEVRARGAGNWVGAIESVTSKKRQRILRAARHFLMKYQGPASDIRFDVMAWEGDSGWSHLRNAWPPPND